MAGDSNRRRRFSALLTRRSIRNLAFRHALGAIIWAPLACVVPGPGFAQDARTAAAQLAARQWLAVTDRGDATASWNAAAKRFQATMTAEQWGQALRQVRTPIGAVERRT